MVMMIRTANQDGTRLRINQPLKGRKNKAMKKMKNKVATTVEAARMAAMMMMRPETISTGRKIDTSGMFLLSVIWF